MNIILKKILFRDLLFLFILAVLFAVVYGRALTFPPRSDYWHIFYVFSHGIKDLKDLGNILTFETFGHPRFQPLAFLILYVEYAFFGSVFILYNLFNQLVAFIILVELYFLMKLLTDSFIFPALLTLLGAFLMSHFDIFTWSYHVYILVGVLYPLRLRIFFFFLYSKNTLHAQRQKCKKRPLIYRHDKTM